MRESEGEFRARLNYLAISRLRKSLHPFFPTLSSPFPEVRVSRISDYYNTRVSEYQNENHNSSNFRVLTPFYIWEILEKCTYCTKNAPRFGKLYRRSPTTTSSEWMVKMASQQFLLPSFFLAHPQYRSRLLLLFSSPFFPPLCCKYGSTIGSKVRYELREREGKRQLCSSCSQGKKTRKAKNIYLTSLVILTCSCISFVAVLTLSDRLAKLWLPCY